jgi:hypothetical protein
MSILATSSSARLRAILSSNARLFQRRKIPLLPEKCGYNATFALELPPPDWASDAASSSYRDAIRPGHDVETPSQWGQSQRFLILESGQSLREYLAAKRLAALISLGVWTAIYRRSRMTGLATWVLN